MIDSSKRLQTVDRALQVLNCFTKDRPIWGVTELARELAVAKSMVARLLETLEAHGFVEKNPETRRYTLGPGLVRLGLTAQATAGDFYRAALPIMEELTHSTTETSLLCVPRDIHSVCVEQVVSPQQGLRLAIELWTVSPLYAGASNKALLAFLPASRIELVIEAGLTAYTPLTISNPAELRAELAQIRLQGWSATSGELSPGVAAVAAPIFDPQGQVLGSLSLGGHESRFTPERIPGLAAQVRAAADRLTRRLAGG